MGSSSSQKHKRSLWDAAEESPIAPLPLLVHCLPSCWHLTDHQPSLLLRSLPAVVSCESPGFLPTCLQAQLWLQWLCLPSWLSPCLALTSVCQVCSSSTLTSNFRETLYQPIWLVHPLPPTCSDFPSPGFRPSKGPSADSSSAHTSWIAASGLAPIPAIDYCNVLDRITCNVKMRLWHIHLGCIKMNSHNTFLLKHVIKWFH